MTVDDALFRFRVRVFALAEELGSAQAACRTMGIHRSTFYRWRKQVDQWGLEALRPRERRHPRMPDATSVFIEQRVLAVRDRPSRVRAGTDRRRARPRGAWPTVCGASSNATD